MKIIFTIYYFIQKELHAKNTSVLTKVVFLGKLSLKSYWTTMDSGFVKNHA